MTPKEQEGAIQELEERVDRLRALYEQYFLGFEKLEPTVPRKDVDRRFAILRKEQIRNTAMRFRFNVVTQKFNTYAMHWVRICRQIEDGTYKRHIRRAKARFGEGRLGERDISVEVDLADFDDLDIDRVLAEADAAAARLERDADPDTVPPPPPPLPAAPVPTGGQRELPELGGQRTLPPAGAASPAPERTARPAALPPGTKPRIVVRKAPSTPGVPVRPRIAPVAGAPRLPAVPSSDSPSAGRLPMTPSAPKEPASSAGPTRDNDRVPSPASNPSNGPPGRPRPSPPLPGQLSKKTQE